jgi:glutamyl/glutaminyl-tRNA synthetase
MSFRAELLAFNERLARHPVTRMRYAPTPSGFLHRGNAFNFLLNYVAARRQAHSRLLLRIDDLDAERKRPEYVEDVFRTLDWLGIDWDEGPRTPAEFEASWSQQHRLGHYHAALEALRPTGLLFACAKSRRDLAPFNGAYPPEFRNQGLSLDAPDVAWRLATPPDFPLPDFVVRRRDGVPAYQLASLADDRLFGITAIVRGEDLRSSTAAQRYLAECLGWTDFLEVDVLHHPLVTGPDGEKLSKSAGADSLRALYESGETPGAIFRELASWLGLEDRRVATVRDLLDQTTR